MILCIGGTSLKSLKHGVLKWLCVQANHFPPVLSLMPLPAKASLQTLPSMFRGKTNPSKRLYSYPLLLGEHQMHFLTPEAPPSVFISKPATILLREACHWFLENPSLVRAAHLRMEARGTPSSISHQGSNCPPPRRAQPGSVPLFLRRGRLAFCASISLGPGRPSVVNLSTKPERKPEATGRSGSVHRKCPPNFASWDCHTKEKMVLTKLRLGSGNMNQRDKETATKGPKAKWHDHKCPAEKNQVFRVRLHPLPEGHLQKGSQLGI